MCALLVAGSAAYFSVLGIATLFIGSYYQVMVMAGSLELGKLIATSYLYRYWKSTVWWLKTYLIIAVFILMGITSMGIFGYLTAAYQVNSGKFELVETQIQNINKQKELLDSQLAQYEMRLQTLNEIRKTQEQRVQDAGNYKTPREQAYAAIDKANEEIKQINSSIQTAQNEKIKKDQEILELDTEIKKAKDIGTFKFVAELLDKPLNTVVTLFIAIIIGVFDPLAVALVLAYNVVTTGNVIKSRKRENNITLAYEDENSVEQSTNQQKTDSRHIGFKIPN